MPLTSLKEGAPIIVTSSDGHRTDFVPGRFAGDILRTATPDQIPHLLKAADVLHGVLMGVHAADPTGGPTNITTDQLRAAHSVIMANPANPDIMKVTKILAPKSLVMKHLVSDELPIQKFYEAVSAMAGAKVVPDARVSLLGTIEQFSGGSLALQERLVKVISPSGTKLDVEAGAANNHHELGVALPSEAVPVTDLAVDSVAKARKIFAVAHSLFSLVPPSQGGLVTRTFFLSNAPDVSTLRTGELKYVPTWTGLAVTPTGAVLAMMHAATGDIAYIDPLTASEVAALADSHLLRPGWKGVVEGIIKVAEIVFLGQLVAGDTLLGLAGSGTGVGAVLAALLMMALLLAMIVKLIDLLKQMQGTTDTDKLVKLLEHIKALIEKALKISPSDPDAKTKLKGTLDQAASDVDKAEGLAEGTGAEEVVDVVRDALDVAIKTVSH